MRSRAVLTAAIAMTAMLAAHAAAAGPAAASEVRLRLSAAGAARLRRSAPLDVILSVRSSRGSSFGGAVRLRIARH